MKQGRPVKVGFLYNHDELHQVAHTAPIISQLQRQCPSLQIDVITSSQAQSDAVTRQLDPDIQAPDFHQLKPHKLYNFIEKLTGRIVPLGRIGFLAENLDLLGSYDAIIVPETTSTLLKTRFRLKGTKLIHYPHGAGDRSICVTPEISNFDLVLLPGPKTQERMLAEKIIRPDNSAIVGYPKFDSRLSQGATSLFDNDRPTVLYNPHFDPKLSSWFKFGIPLLEYFAQQQDFNLILAPHVMLFRRKLLASIEHRIVRLGQNIPDRFYNVDHIHIDKGSIASTDMSYTRAADIYLGDVSSQVCEFIETARPAIFLNSHEADWQNDPSYGFWKFGPVAQDMAGFKKALQEALPMSEHYKAEQTEAFSSFIDHKPDEAPSARAANAIKSYLEREFSGRLSDG